MSHNKKYSEHIQIIQNDFFLLALHLLCMNSANTIILKTNQNKYREKNSIIHSLYSISDLINGK